MKKLMLLISFVLTSLFTNAMSYTDDYVTTVTFPAGFQIGDYVEFVKVNPINAGSSGNYEISISYTRNFSASGATHLVAIGHYAVNVWREVGRVNSNPYFLAAHNFTIDCNGDYQNSRLRVRAVSIHGTHTQPLTVHIKIRSININGTFTPLNTTGNDVTVNKFMPMTSDWSLYVGNPTTADPANIAIKAIENGNVGIGTATPAEKLSVNGKVRAREIKVDVSNWPDYVFEKNYELPSLQETEKQIKAIGHLPGIPSSKEVSVNGVDLGELNTALLKKVEELTLYLIDESKQRKFLADELNQVKDELKSLKQKSKKR